MHIFGITISDKIYMPILIIIVAVILEKLLKLLIKLKYENKKVQKRNNKKFTTISVLLKNLSKYIIYIIALLAILKVFGINTAALVTGVGVISLVLGLAVQDLLKDILAGLAIILEGQLSIGDYVKVNDFLGYVIYVGIKTTKIQAYSGEIYIVSNRNINTIINYSIDRTLAIVDLSIGYEEDIDKVEKILKVTAANLCDKIELLEEEIEVLGVQDLSDSSVVIRVVGKCKPAKHIEVEKVERMMRKEFKKSLDKNGIKIPYPQVEVHNAK